MQQQNGLKGDESSKGGQIFYDQLHCVPCELTFIKIITFSLHRHPLSEINASPLVINLAAVIREIQFKYFV